MGRSRNTGLTEYPNRYILPHRSYAPRHQAHTKTGGVGSLAATSQARVLALAVGLAGCGSPAAGGPPTPAGHRPLPSTTLAKRLPTRVDGIVPDGVHHVIVRSIGDASRAVPVARNAYEVIVVNPRSVSFVAEQAGHRRRYVVPTLSTARRQTVSLAEPSAIRVLPLVSDQGLR